MTAFVTWLQHDTAGLLTLAAISVAVLLHMIIKFQLEPFVALIVVGLLIALMERSGGADSLTSRLLRLFGPRGAPLAMGLTGLILGIPSSSTSASSCSHHWSTSRRSAVVGRWCCTRCRCSPACR